MSGLTKQADNYTDNFGIYFSDQKAIKQQKSFLSGSFSLPLQRSQRSPDDVIAIRKIESALYLRTKSVIETIPRQQLRDYASKGDSYIERILNSHIEWAIEAISHQQLKDYAIKSDINLERILNSFYEKLIRMIPEDNLKLYANGGDFNIGQILNSRSEWAIAVIPNELLKRYAKSDANIEKILNSRSERAIKMIPVGLLRVYVSTSITYLEKILDSRSEWAIRIIPRDMLNRYVRIADNSHIEKILNSRSEWVIRMIPTANVKKYAGVGDAARIEKILDSRSERMIFWVPVNKLIDYANKDEASINRVLASKSVNTLHLVSKDALKRYASVNDFNIEKILESSFEELIKIIPETTLEAYANSDDELHLEKILESRSDWAINLIPANKLRNYAATSGNSHIEKILNSRSTRAIDLIPDDKLAVYALKGNMKIILESKSVKAVNLVSDDRLKSYVEGNDLHIEYILTSQVDKAIDIIPSDRLKTYVRKDDFNLVKVLNSLSKKAIKQIPIDLLKLYVSKGGSARIEKILKSGSEWAVNMIPVSQLKNYAKGSDAHIKKILESGFSHTIKAISSDNLLSHIYGIRSHIKNRVFSLERQDSSVASLDNEEIIMLEKMLDSSVEVIDLHFLEKFRAYAKGGDTHIEKILSSRSERIISLLSDTQLASYARKGNKYIENILDSRSERAISCIPNAQFNTYIERGNKDKNIIDAILGSRSEKAIGLIPDDSLESYAKGDDANIGKILDSRSKKAIGLIPDDSLESYAKGDDANIGKILDSRSKKAIGLIPDDSLEAYAEGGDVNIGKILDSRSRKAIGLIPDDSLESYAKRDNANIGKILDSRSKKAIGLLMLDDSLESYAKGDDINIGKVLDSQFSKLIKSIPLDRLKAYLKEGDTNIEKALSSRSEIAIGLISANKLKAYASQGDVNVEKMMASGSDRVIKLIPHNCLASYAQTLHRYFKGEEPYLYTLKKTILETTSVEACLPGPSGYRPPGRSKRDVLLEGCEITWEDVDEFNEEEEKAREFKAIKINSEKFLSYIQEPSHSESKRMQLLQLIDKVTLTGNAKEQVNELLKSQKILLYLNKVNRVASIATYGLAAKNILRDFLQEDYKGVVINLGFITGGQGFAKVAEVSLIRGTQLALNGQRLLGQSLKLASPFIARGTSAFIIYDLVSQIKMYTGGDPDALVGMVGDSIYLSIEGAELGIEIAEVMGTLEGVSSFTGPIGAGVGALVLVGTDIYLAVKRVKQEDALIHLTTKEKWVEGLRAFMGMGPRPEMKTLIEERQANNQLYLQGVTFLKNHPDIQRYIFPIAVFWEDCSVDREDASDLIEGGSGVYVTSLPVNCTSQWQTDVSSVVMLDEKRKNIKWSRSKPDAPEGRLFCAPVALLGDQGEVSHEETYFCDQAIGIEYTEFRTDNITFIALGDGNSTIYGFPQGKHLVKLGNGNKIIRLGMSDDTILLDGNSVIGRLDGGGGVNTLDLGSFATQEIVRTSVHATKYDNGLNQSFFSYPFSIYVSDDPIIVTQLNEANSLKAEQIQRFLFRTDKQDIVWLLGCYVRFVDARGGGTEREEEDYIGISRHILEDDCAGNLTLIIRPHTQIYNSDISENSIYTYILPRQEGSAVITVDLSGSTHQFVFEATLLDLDGFKWEKREDNAQTITVAFLNLNEPLTLFNLQIKLNSFPSDGANQRLLFKLGDNAEIKILEDKFYVFQKTNHSVEEIIREYPSIANRFNFMMFIHSLLSNESIAIGHGLHDVLHNDPYRRSHLIGNGGENIFVVSLGERDDLDRSQLAIPEIVLYDEEEQNLIDTLDLRPIKKQLEEILDVAIEARVNLVQGTKDLFIELYDEENPTCNLLAVQLKDALLTNWYRRLHIILNHVPMKLDASNLKLKPLSLMFSPRQAIILIDAKDIEEKMLLMIPKRIGNYHFLRWEEDDLMLTNAFDKNATEAERYVLLFRYFYEIRKLESLSIEFVDKELVLKDEIEHIEDAVDFSSEYEFYNHTVYGMLFNKKNLTEDVVVSPARVSRSLHQEAIGEERVKDVMPLKVNDHTVGQAIFLKWLFYCLGWKTVVKRMNKAERALAQSDKRVEVKTQPRFFQYRVSASPIPSNEVQSNITRVEYPFLMR